MTPSEIRRLVDVNQIKRIHFGHVAIFFLTGLLSALVEIRPFTTMSEVEVNQWDELSQFSFCERRFTDPIATNGVLLEGFMFAIGWCKCSTKNEQFGSQRITRESLLLCRFPIIQTIAYARAGCQRFTCKSLRLYKLPKIQTTPDASHANPYIVQVPNNLNVSLCQRRLPMIHMQILRLVQVPDNSNNSLCQCRLWKMHMQILMLEKVPSN
ncbi:hypothetical protein O181_082365 [Austropuccinia psidii MF-1]|uniref:Uncharacterized protein n=1 Tax=Austropuccinia psidii MF-1 TaxID=1389203 RepID=A0A9Q3IKS6_9BASI|nr:hypothetical protein [Austropuccinia psidii MF-1]